FRTNTLGLHEMCHDCLSSSLERGCVTIYQVGPAVAVTPATTLPQVRQGLLPGWPAHDRRRPSGLLARGGEHLAVVEIPVGAFRPPDADFHEVTVQDVLPVAVGVHPTVQDLFGRGVLPGDVLADVAVLVTRRLDAVRNAFAVQFVAHL